MESEAASIRNSNLRNTYDVFILYNQKYTGVRVLCFLLFML